jgi:hypothetical protein
MTISTIFGDLNKKTLERIFTRILIPSKKEEYKKALGSVSFLFSMIPDKIKIFFSRADGGPFFIKKRRQEFCVTT